MINKQRSRALEGFAVEVEPQAPQPVEGISSAFLQAYLDCMSEQLQEDIKQLKKSFMRTGFMQYFDTNEGSDQVPH